VKTTLSIFASNEIVCVAFFLRMSPDIIVDEMDEIGVCERFDDLVGAIVRNDEFDALHLLGKEDGGNGSHGERFEGGKVAGWVKFEKGLKQRPGIEGTAEISWWEGSVCEWRWGGLV
jgi:hypothetical protein